MSLKKHTGWLAPLNYDRFFNKVFSNLSIVKDFLQDFFDIEIQNLRSIKKKQTFTDDSQGVEFDFRCEIDGKPVIIEMQQWFKIDITKRFYTYHCINTGLQLENLPFKSMPLFEKEEQKIRDYSDLEPVITLIWMVDDKLGFTEDYIIYQPTPDVVSKFIENKILWKNPDIKELLKKRDEALKILQNDTKDLGFLKKNKLIFTFQKNIINNKTKSRYYKWFKFAADTLKKDNKKDDFIEYKEKSFLQMIKRLQREYIKSEESKYINNYDEFIERVKRLENGFRKQGLKDGHKIGVEEGQKIGHKEGEKNKVIQIAKKLIKQDYDNKFIIEITDLKNEEIDKLRIE